MILLLGRKIIKELTNHNRRVTDHHCDRGMLEGKRKFTGEYFSDLENLPLSYADAHLDFTNSTLPGAGSEEMFARL